MFRETPAEGKDPQWRGREDVRVVSLGRQIISAQAQVLAQDGRVLAHGMSTILVLAGGR